MTFANHHAALFGAAAFGLALACAGPARGQDNTSMIYLKDGHTLGGQIVAVETDRLKWQLPGLPQSQTVPYDRIDYVEFPRPQDWLDVMAVFDSGAWAKAAETFKGISLQRNRTTHYPAPGNFATLAERRLLDCYRRLRMPIEIALVSKRIEWQKLAKSERDIAGIIDCWAALGNGDWQGARAAFEKARKEVADTDPASSELGYLAGLIEIGLGNPAEASVRFGRAYGPDAAADAGMAADAMKRAIEQILPDPERRPELRALVHLYAELHGNGKLWGGAGDFLTKIHAEGFTVEMSLASGAEVDGESEDKDKDGKMPAEATPTEVMARYVRVERSAEEDTVVAFSEVEVHHGGINIAKKGKATQSSDGMLGRRTMTADRAIDGNAAPGFSAGSFSRTKKERRPWWQLDLGGMETISRIEIYGHKDVEGLFAKPPGIWRVRLLDGDRKEVWAQSVDPGDGIKVGFDVKPITKEEPKASGPARVE